MRHIYAGRALLGGVAWIALSGCATSAKNIDTAYVSPLEYQHYDCDQIGTESTRVSARASQLAGELDQNATGDAVAMGVGLVLFWPALFFVEGDGTEAAEYARLKGQYNALQQASIEKKCAIEFRDIASEPAVNPAPAKPSTLENWKAVPSGPAEPLPPNTEEADSQSGISKPFWTN